MMRINFIPRILSGRLTALALPAVAVAVGAGCGATPGGESAQPAPLAAEPVPVAAGRGPEFRIAPHPPALRGQPIAGRRCLTAAGPRDLAHVELFAAGRVVPIPAGIGVAPPLVRRRAQVLAGRCSYAARTTEPTGLIELRRGERMSLGAFFAIWGQPLSRTRMATFGGTPVRAYLDGRRWPGDPARLPLRRHAVVVVEVGPFVAPHARYRFPPGR